jgi:beta-phosphoglucomutase-like phosphatase (HAD superfamily)
MLRSMFYGVGTAREVASADWSRLVKDRNYRGVIFDCDGTLVNSADAHFAAFRDAVREQGYDLSQSWYEARTGLDRAATLAAFERTLTGPFDVPEAVAASMRHFMHGDTAILPIPATKSLVQSLSGQLAMAVGTNCETPLAERSLKTAGLGEAFAHVVSVSDGLPPKPSPAIFTAARERLGTKRADTLVFEDSNEGRAAAIAAGMDVVQIVHDPQ